MMDSQESGPSTYSPSPIKNPCLNIADRFTFQEMANIVDHANKYSFQAAVNRYAKLNGNKSTIYQIIKFIENDGNKSFKLEQIKQFMYNKFNVTRDNGGSIHYWHLIFWAKEAAKQFNLDLFKCSRSFLDKFKRDHRISSRRITKFVTKTYIKDTEALVNIANEFVERTNKKIETNSYEPKQIWNTDQSRFEYEMTSARTLSFKGERHNCKSAIN